MDRSSLAITRGSPEVERLPRTAEIPQREILQRFQLGADVTDVFAAQLLFLCCVR